jgi:hypothetical protein
MYLIQVAFLTTEPSLVDLVIKSVVLVCIRTVFICDGRVVHTGQLNWVVGIRTVFYIEEPFGARLETGKTDFMGLCHFTVGDFEWGNRLLQGCSLC